MVEEKDKVGHPTTHTTRIWNIFICIVVVYVPGNVQPKKLEKQNENKIGRLNKIILRGKSY